MGYMQMFWIAIIIGSLIGEVLSMDLTSVWFTGAGLVALALSLMEVSIEWQIAAFLVISIALVISVRPIVRKKLAPKEEYKSNTEKNIGKTAVVVKDILGEEVGKIKIAGKLWLALSENGTNIKEDSKVEIVAIEGSKFIVKKIK